MSSPRTGIWSLVVVFAFGFSAYADPITYSVTAGEEQTVAILPDPAQGGTVAVGSWMYPSISATGSTDVMNNFDQTTSFEIRYSPVPPPQGDYSGYAYVGLPALDVTATISGWIDYAPNASYWDREGGQFTTTSLSVSIDRDADAANIPAALLDLLNHPERLHLSGPVQLHEAGDPPGAYLTIDPPGPGSEAPVPEPTTLAVFAAGLVVLAIRRLRSKT